MAGIGEESITISNLTIVGNNSSGGTAGGLWVATFGAPVNVTIADNIIADNGTNSCQIEGGAAAVLTSFGGRPGRRARRQRSADADLRAARRQPGDRRRGWGVPNRPARCRKAARRRRRRG